MEKGIKILVSMCIRTYKRPTMYKTREIIRISGDKGWGRVLREVINYLLYCAQFPLSPAGCQGMAYSKIQACPDIPGVSGPLL